MDEIIACPQCHQPVVPADYFCPNCGKKLHSPPLSTTPTALLVLALKTLLLPPFGLYWGYRYLRQSDQTSKIVGLAVIIITIMETVWLIFATIAAVNTAQQQINGLMNSYGS
jgi:hypothetical protein